MQTRYQHLKRTLIASSTRLLLACVLMFQLAGAAYAASVTIAWDPNAESSVAGYNIYRSSQSGVFTSAALNTTPTTLTSFTDSTAQNSQTYYYVVKAVSADGTQSISSNQVQVVTSVGTPPLAPPTGLSAQCSADNKNFTIRWNAVAGAANYYVGVDYKANNSAAAFESWFVAGSPDYYLNQATALTFTGAVTPGQGYEWWVGANTTAPGTGPWTAGIGFTCGDATAPTVALTAPAAGAAISGLATVSADAADNIGVVGVQFKVNGVNLGAEVTGAPYSQAWDTAALANGSFTLSAVARDLVGNQTTSAPVTVTVNRTLVAPAGLSAQCSADNKNFTIRWNAVAGAANYYVGVDYKANNSAAAFESWYVAGSPDYYFDQTTALTFTGSVTPGQGYEWWVGANTTAPGTGPWTAGIGFTCGDTTVPTVSLTAPAAGAAVSGLATVSADAADNIGVVGVQFKVNGVNLGAEVTSAPYSQAWDTAVLANGSFTLSAVARDLAGNQTTSAPVTVAVNYPLVAPAGLSAQCSADNKSFTIRWNAVAGAANYYVGVDYKANNSAATFESWFVAGSPDYYLDQATALTFTGSVTPGQGYEWWVGVNTTAPGTGPWTAGTGFTCAAARTISITAPASGATIAGNEVTVSAAASSNVGIVGVQFKLNGANLGTSDATAPYSTKWNTKNQANGVYSLTSVATDTAGKQTVSAPISVRIQKGAASSLQIIDTDGNSQANASPETMTAGYARSETAAQGVAIVSLKSGDIVVSETAVPASVPVLEGRVYVAVSDQVNTGLAISNDNNEEARISFYFTDSEGTDFAHDSFTLEPKGQKIAFVNQAPFNLPAALEGSLTFNSSIPVSVAALRGLTNERGEFLMTTLPVTPVGVTPAGTSIVFAHFADGEGWNSQVVLTNPTDAALAGTVQFFAPGSSDVHAAARTMTVNGVTGSTFSYTIAPRSSVRLAVANPGTELQAGYALATAAPGSALPQGLLISSYAHQGITVSQAGVPAVSTGTAFRTYVESLGSLQSGLAIANPSDSPAQATLELTALDGTATGLTASLEIPAGGHVSQYVNQLFPAIADGFQGMLRLVSTQPLAVVGVRTRSNERGDFLFTTMPVADDAAPAVNGADLVFPLVVNGGGYSTEFVGIH